MRAHHVATACACQAIAPEATSVGQDQVSLKLDSTKPKCHSYSVQHPYLRMDTLRNQFVDNETWVSLARRFYVRLPNWRTEPTNENMRRWLRRFRVTETQYLEATGYKSLAWSIVGICRRTR